MLYAGCESAITSHDDTTGVGKDLHSNEALEGSVVSDEPFAD